MHIFNTLSVEEKTTLLKWFKYKPNGEKIKRPYFEENFWSRITPELPNTYGQPPKHSIIKINGELYQIASGHEALIGKGQYGKVKFVQHLLTGQQYAVKIQKFKLREQEKQNILQENAANLDVNLSLSSVIRAFRDNGYKHYSLMHYHGKNLTTTLESPVCDDQRLNISIDLCFEVYKLHTGLLSNHSEPYAHLDIKPANISINKQYQPTLVDYGLAQKAPQDVYLNAIGTPVYMPSINMIAFDKLTQEEMDIWALKRTLFMPSVFKCFMGGRNDDTNEHHGYSFLLPQDIAKQTPLFEYINTGGGKDNKSHLSIKALTLGALIVLAKYGATSHFYTLVNNNQQLAYLTLALHYINQEAPINNFKAVLIKALCVSSHSSISLTTPFSENDMNNLKNKALLLSFGLKEDIELACDHQRLITILRSNNSLAIKKSAIILFKLSILDDAPYVDDQKIIDLDFIPILQTYPELSPHIQKLYNNQQHDKIISCFLVPVSLTIALKNLKDVNSVLSIFEMSRNKHALNYLVHSPSIKHTRALLYMFHKNPNINSKELERINRFQIDAIDFLIEHKLDNLFNFVLKGNNALFIHNIKRLIASNLINNAHNILPLMLENISQHASYVEMIKTNPAPERQFIIYHLIISNIIPKPHINHLFIHDKACNYLYKTCQELSLPLSIIKKIMNEPKAMHAFIHLIEKDIPQKIILRELHSDIRILQINEQINLSPLPVSNALQEINAPSQPMIAPSVRKKRNSFSNDQVNSENCPRKNNGANHWSEKIKEENNHEGNALLPAIKPRPHSHNVVSEKYPNDQHRHRMFNPITHQEQKLPPAKPKAWRY